MRVHVNTYYRADGRLADQASFGSIEAAQNHVKQIDPAQDDNIAKLLIDLNHQLVAALCDETTDDPISIQHSIDGLVNLQNLYRYEVAPCTDGHLCIACLEAGLIQKSAESN